MSSTATIRGLVELDLRDTGNATWSDAQLDRHIQRAVREYSLFNPLEDKDTLTTTAGSRDIDISTLAPRIRVVAVEYPTGLYPKSWAAFSVWINLLTLEIYAAPAGVENVTIYWHKLHTLHATVDASSTFPADDDDLIATGAVGYAAQELVAVTANKVNVGGEEAWGRYTALAGERLRDFRDRCRKLPAASRIKTGRTYTPIDAAFKTETTDPGPL